MAAAAAPALRMKLCRTSLRKTICIGRSQNLSSPVNRERGLDTSLSDDVSALGVENPQSRGKSLPMSSGPGCDSAASRHSSLRVSFGTVQVSAEDVEHVCSDSRLLREEQSGDDHRLALSFVNCPQAK